MIFERSDDLELVRAIITHPRIYPHVRDDASPEAADWQPRAHPWLWYVVVRDGAEVLGLWACERQNAVTWELHTCLLPSAWGPRAKVAAREFLVWFFQAAPGCERVITSVPAYNRLAWRFARAGGLTEYGRNPRSFLRRGELHDQILLGLSKCQ